jgi:hypothetical protein
MPLHFATAPKNGTSLVQAGLNRVSTRTSPLSAAAIDFRALEISEPHAVYDLRADKVAGGGGLASATLTGFRYLVTGGGAAIAAAEVLTDATRTATLLANINYGRFVEATSQALTQVAALPAVGTASYEVRLLRFSAIALMSLWLKPDSGTGDIIYPLAPAPSGLQAGQSYSAADFITAILPLAEKRSAKKDPATLP